MALRTFRMRLLLWTSALLLIALAGFFLLVTRTVEQQFVTEARVEGQKKLAAVHWMLQREQPFAHRLAFDAWAKELGQRLGVRITYIADGKVLADSTVAAEMVDAMENHADRPEVVQALGQGTGMDIRTSSTLGRKMLYLAERTDATAGLPDGVLRLAVPFSQLAGKAEKARGYLFWAFLGVLLITAGLGIVVTRMLARSITTFTATAENIGHGDYTQRIQEVPGGEFEPLAEAVNTMAQEIEGHVARLTAERERLAAMFEGMVEGVLVLDAEGRIERSNKAWLAMFPGASGPKGLTPLEATRRLEVQNLVDQSARRREPGVTRGPLELPDGRSLVMSAVTYPDEHGETRTIVVFNDVSETRRNEEALKRFVANVSHQLRTPLTSIRGYAETLLDNPPESRDDAKRFLRTIERNAKHMDSMVSDMLALARSEKAGADADLRPVDVGQILEHAMADLAPMAQGKNIRFETHLEPMQVLADAEGLLHVLHNLLHNALKHSPEGVTITVQGLNENGEALFCVCDQGPGIPLELSERVFEPFYRVDPNPVGEQCGSGLGLAICRRILRNFGGEIWLERPDGGHTGSAFCFRLKIAEHPENES